MFMVESVFHSILMVRNKIGDDTMNVLNAEFMAIKMTMTTFSWLFH